MIFSKYNGYDADGSRVYGKGLNSPNRRIIPKIFLSAEDYLRRFPDDLDLDDDRARGILAKKNDEIRKLLAEQQKQVSVPETVTVPDVNLNQAAAASSELAAPQKVDADVTAAVNPIFKTLNQAYAANKYKVEEQQNQLDTGLSTRSEYSGQVS